jgi:hypothetical protein
MYYELAPAHGRDYKSAAEVKNAFETGKDFIGDYQLNFRLVNKTDIPIGSTANLRYRANRNVVSVKVNNHEIADEPAPRTVKAPSEAAMMKWMFDGVAKATDGCRVEPDGHCSHGKPSWLLEMGLI